MAKVTVQDVADAEEALRKAKGASHGAPNSDTKRRDYERAAQRAVDIRQAFRQQEQDAGRRSGFAGGDADPQEG